MHPAKSRFRRRLFLIVASLSALFLLTQLVDNIPLPFLQGLEVERLVLASDYDGDGIDDLADIVQGARAEVANKTRYRSRYYAGGYPPEDEGVCTDVIWRAFEAAGYNLKNMIDADIAQHTELYPRVLVEGQPDPNIDFRRVPNLNVFFQRHAQVLTTEVVPNDPDNLSHWQGGDIVVFGERGLHIAIVSDKRRLDGVPYIIHNAYRRPKEEDGLLSWPDGIAGHYRYPKLK